MNCKISLSELAPQVCDRDREVSESNIGEGIHIYVCIYICIMKSMECDEFENKEEMKIVRNQSQSAIVTRSRYS